MIPMREKTTTDRDCSVELGARRRAPAATGVLRRLRRDERGLIAALTALIAVALVGTVGLAIDLGVWYRQTRGMQNAADAAALAAAQDATSATFLYLSMRYKKNVGLSLAVSLLEGSSRRSVVAAP
jgi:uncharacterized membrane protein